MLPPSPLRRSTTLLPTLLAWGGTSMAGAEELGEPKIEAPSVEFDLHDGALLAPHGFVARLGERLVMGDALRYDREHDDFYASGRVVYVMPGVRLHAARLGMHPKAESGDAWEVTVYIENSGRSMRLSAERAHFDRLNVILEGIHGDGGHGGVVSVNATAAHVYLRERPAEDKQGFRREVAGVSLTSASTCFLGVPVLWLPYAYRDFLYDYPWTRFVGGTSLRLGTYARGWIASDLPGLAGWTPRLEARGDLYSRTGPGYGGDASWRNPEYGAGLFSWFDTPREIVMGGSDDRQNLETRSAHVLDAEQKLHTGFDGLGAGALYARWVTVPVADPPGLGLSPTGVPPDERYRADYLRDDLDHRPLARRGVTGAWTLPYGSLVLDTERRDQIDLQTTDRLFGAEVVLPQVQLAGPVHLSGDAWFEDLDREFANTAALRTRFSGGLGYLDWFGPWGLDAGAGAMGLRYDQGRIAGFAFDQPQVRWLPVASAGIRLRIVGTFDDGVINTITPRIGYQALGTGHGEVLPIYGFGDNRDLLLENKRYLLTGVDTAVTKGTAPLFVGTFLATWALREQDKEYLDLSNQPQRADNRLVSLVGHVQGTPTPTIILAGDVNYDAQSHTWNQFDATASWVADRALVWRYTGALIPADLFHSNIWQQTPGCTVIANRYRYDLDLTFQPGTGRALAGISVEASRRMVDGLLTVFFEQVRNPDGGLYDQRIGVGFSTTFSAQPATTPVTPTHSTGVGFH